MSSVGQGLGGVVGAVIGWFVGGPQGAIYGAQIGMAVGTAIDPPKGPTIHGPRLADLSVQTATYGAHIPRIYGTVGTYGNVFWVENNKLKEVVKKKQSGGKGGGGGSTVKTYSYYATFAVGLADTTKTGAIAGVRRIWVGSKLIYDAGATDIESIIASNRAAEGFAIYLGTEDQEPDPRMQAALGVANCPAYRGLAYIVFYDYPLADHGNSLLGAPVKVEVVGVSDGGTVNIGLDKVPKAAAAFGSESGAGFMPDFTDFRYVHTFGANAQYVDIYEMRIAREWTQARIDSTGANVSVPMYGLVCYDDEMWAGWDEVTIGATRIRSESGRYYGLWWGGKIQYLCSTGDGFFLYMYAASQTQDDLLDKAIRIQDVGATENPVLIFAETSGLACPSGFRLCTAGGKMFAYRMAAGVLAVQVFTDGYAIDYQFTVQVQEEQWPMVTTPDTAGPLSIKALWRDEKLCLLYRYGSGQYRFGVFDQTGVVRNYVFTAGDTMILGFDLFDVDQGVLSGTRVIHWRRYDDGVALLSDIVSSECLQSNILRSSDLDVSALTQDVRGYRIASTGAIRGAIEPLQAAWPFDVIQSGYKLKFVPRGQASVATIPATDLDARPEGDAPGVQLPILREMDTQLPRRVVVKHLDVGREYDNGEQPAERLNTDSIHVSEVELPVVLDATEARGIAEVLLYLYWLERRDVSFRLPPSYRALEPADVVTITGEWGTYELRLAEVHLLSDGRLECRAKYSRAAIYTPTAPGAAGGSTGQTIALDGPSYYALLDIPLLREQDDEPGFPAAMAGYSTGWPGGIIYRSSDEGQTWTDLQAFGGPVTLGFARDTIGAGRTDIIDATNVLQVDILAGELESVSDLTMFGGANHFAYGADGRWEICAARDCVLQGDGSYKLSNWLRGRMGTEWAMTTHQDGDVLVLLADLDMAFIGMETGSIGQQRIYRGITAGRSIDSGSDAAFTYRGVNLAPLSPIRINGHRDPSTSDWTLSWTRRTRIPSTWGTASGVPLGEASQAYEIEIYASSAYSTVKRTLTASGATVQYTSAQQVADFGANQATLYVKVYQISATVGRGYPLTASISR